MSSAGNVRELVLHIDRGLGLSARLHVPQHCTLEDVKARLLDTNPTGLANTSAFELRLPFSAGGRPLGVGEVVPQGVEELDLGTASCAGGSGTFTSAPAIDNEDEAFSEGTAPSDDEFEYEGTDDDLRDDAQNYSHSSPAAATASLVNGPIFLGAPVQGGSGDLERTAGQTLQAHRAETAARARYSGQAKHASAWVSQPSAASAELRSAELAHGPRGTRTTADISREGQERGPGKAGGIRSLDNAGAKEQGVKLLEALGPGHQLGGRPVPSFSEEGAKPSQVPSETEKRLQNAERRLRALEAAEQRRRSA